MPGSASERLSSRGKHDFFPEKRNDLGHKKRRVNEACCCVGLLGLPLGSGSPAFFAPQPGLVCQPPNFRQSRYSNVHEEAAGCCGIKEFVFEFRFVSVL